MEIVRYVIEGWPVRREQSSADVMLYWSYKEEISLINGILFKGERLIIPASMRKAVLKQLHKTDAATVIKKIKNVFSRMGLPEVLRNDNGPQYAAKTFEKFAKDWGFQHIPKSPEYPRSNGLAEKTVQTVKDLLEKAKEDNKDPYLAMLEVRNTPVDNYKSPAELAFGRQLRSILPVSPNNLIVKSVDNDEFKQRRSDLKGKQKEYYDQHTKELKNLHNGENM